MRYVDGCRGIAGGRVEEPVEGDENVNSYLVYVGWETVKKHDDYHHTAHFRKHYSKQLFVSIFLTILFRPPFVSDCLEMGSIDKEVPCGSSEGINWDS